jgi:hypothetical protein
MGRVKKIWFVRENPYHGQTDKRNTVGRTKMQYCRPDKPNSSTEGWTKMQYSWLDKQPDKQYSRPDKRNTVGRTNGRTKVRLG